jgi:hypothetical protein
MTIHLLPFWDIMVDALQIILCGIILIFLIRNKIKYKQLLLKTTSSDKSASFENEILVQSLRQQTAQTFDAILEYIDQQRHGLQSYVENEAHHRYSSPAGSQTNAPQKINEKINEEFGTDTNSADHGSILQLSESGLTPKQISQRVMASREEVELVLRMNSRFTDGQPRDSLRAEA